MSIADLFFWTIAIIGSIALGCVTLLLLGALHPDDRSALIERAKGVALGAGAVIGLVLALGIVGESDYQIAKEAERSAERARERAVAAYLKAQREQREARHQRQLADGANRLLDARRGEAWR